MYSYCIGVTLPFLPQAGHCNINTSLKHKVQCTAEIFLALIWICVLDES